MVPEAGPDKQTNMQFNLTIQALKDGALDANAFFTLTEFGADSNIIEYSTDGGKTWSAQTPTITLSNGQASIMAQITSEGTSTITAKADDAQTATLTVKAAKPKGKKVIKMKFTNPDGSEKTLKFELEEK
jgi:hypothetical protein